jgi:hypothetical protein
MSIETQRHSPRVVLLDDGATATIYETVGGGLFQVAIYPPAMDAPALEAFLAARATPVVASEGGASA